MIMIVINENLPEYWFNNGNQWESVNKIDNLIFFTNKQERIHNWWSSQETDTYFYDNDRNAVR